MIWHSQRIYKSPFFVFFKKHYCPCCGSKLSVKQISRVVHSRSEESKDFDFSSGDTYMIGNVKFTWDVFYCESCNIEYTVQEMKRLEADEIK